MCPQNYKLKIKQVKGSSIYTLYALSFTKDKGINEAIIYTNDSNSIKR